VSTYIVYARESSTRREKDSEAQQTMVQAEVLRTTWNETSLRQSAEQFDKAALIWKSLGDFSNASRATLKSGDVYFDVSRYREAFRRYQDAVALAAKKADWLAEATALTKLARLDSYYGHNDLAQEHITAALDLLKHDQRNLTQGANSAYGEALTSLGELAHARGNFKKALTHFEEALKSLGEDGNGQARVYIFIGYIKGSIGNIDNALAEINQALRLYQSTNNKAGEGQALSALGLVYLHKKEFNQSIELNKSALEIFRTIGDRHSEGIANNALGQTYELLHDNPLALKHYKRALQLFEEIDAVNGIAPTNCLVAGVQNPDQALAYYERCLNLSRAAEMGRTEVKALIDIANFYVAQQRFELALAQHQRILKFFERIGDRRGLEMALSLYGDLLLKTGKKERAADVYEQALSLSEQIGDEGTQISMLSSLALTNLTLGAPEEALSYIERSVKLIEDLRANVASPEFRTSYFSGVQQHYKLYIQILAQLERLHPGEGYAARAFLVSERSRARLLQDLVRESRANIRAGAPKELLDLESELRELIRLQAEYRLDLVSNKKHPDELAETENQLIDLKAQYQQVEAQIRQQNPYLLSLEQVSPQSLYEIQRELHGSDTMLLEYSLGVERSYLFVVTSDSIQMHELASGKSLEDASRELYKLITPRQGTDGQIGRDYQATIEDAEDRYLERAGSLSQMLLGPVAGKLGKRRLIIVVEGALQYIPFAALPVPIAKNIGPESKSQPLLVETNEIVVEPSFSALIAIRQSKPQHAGSPSRLVAVIADPVLNPTDDRVQGSPVAPSTVLAATDKIPPKTSEALTRDARLTRLIHASEEADAISAAAPWATTMVAKGFDASRETAMSADIGQYQIVHFATHGIVDTEHPELSGIVLTMVDRNGVKTDGFMSLHDIYSLDLSAELTVLSACQTALGKDIKGEGFVGLSHALMSAGSKSVVASLWKVDDRATAVLMRNLYQSMLQQGMSPAAALRSAQLNMMRDKQYNAPYYWAGFVIQGEYTNRIAVDHHASFRIALVLLFLLSLVAGGVLLFHKRKRRLSSTQST
jgi:CHAT domain-containing protein/predicted negative regulator of RcsB-dependent stress response